MTDFGNYIPPLGKNTCDESGCVGFLDVVNISSTSDGKNVRLRIGDFQILSMDGMSKLFATSEYVNLPKGGTYLGKKYDEKKGKFPFQQIYVTPDGNLAYSVGEGGYFESEIPFGGGTIEKYNPSIFSSQNITLSDLSPFVEILTNHDGSHGVILYKGHPVGKAPPYKPKNFEILDSDTEQNVTAMSLDGNLIITRRHDPYGRLEYSTDYGKTWKKASTQFNEGAFKPAISPDGQSAFVQSYAYIPPKDPGYIFTLWYSTSLNSAKQIGDTWEPMTIEPTIPLGGDFAVSSSGNEFIKVGMDKKEKVFYKITCPSQ